ncbi:hypothetical protein G5B47_02590 [Paenibacillus sp. 7124]|uniref:Uncharacterized protein n=1 Tax=Paenibacillus apii TaxID=1850370 RepID=A0A6M1PDL6_9BACL|nr:hypothetical protein [Paenibacillus apii]NGM81296.1 hypothetical protein [Paenibacillus apii]
MIKRLKKYIATFVGKHIDDLLIIIGLFFIVHATFYLSFVAGLYTLGGILLLIGIYFTLPRR